MEKIFANADEKYLENVILYAQSDNFLYLEKGHANKVGAEDLLNLCMKGKVLVNKADTFYAPIAFKKESTYVSVTIETGSSATAAITVLKSANFAGK